MKFDARARKIRDEIKIYSAESVINVLLGYLAQPPGTEGEVEKKPWVALLALEWTFELAPESGKKIATKEDVHRILTRLWQTQHIAANLNAQRPVELVLRALIIPQLKIQKSENFYRIAFARTYLIITRYSTSKRLQSAFIERAGVSIDDFVQIALFIMISLSSSRAGSCRMSYSEILGSLVGKYDLKAISSSLRMIGIGVKNLIEVLRGNTARNIRSDEYFRDSIFYCKPVMLLEHEIASPHPNVILRGISESLINQFISCDEQLRREFTKAFEKYIEDILSASRVTLVPERELLKFYQKHGIKDQVVDFVIFEDGGVIAIDAKGVDPKSKTTTATRQYDIAHRIRDYHLKGVEQAIRTLQNLEQKNYPAMNAALPRYAVIVTHQDFFVGTGAQFKNYIGDCNWKKLEELADGVIDLKNIHFISVAQLEILLKLRETYPRCLIDFLGFVSESSGNEATKAFEIEQYIQRFSAESLCQNGYPFGGDKAIDCFEVLCEQIISNIEETRRNWYEINSLQKRVDAFYHNYIEFIDLMVKSEPKQ